MKYLIIYCHPNPQSFNHAIKDAVEGALRKKGGETRVRDLYQLKFDPVLKGSDLEAFKRSSVPDDIKREQDEIRWAEILVFVFPIWWTGLPAMVKGYIDRVFSHGFAYALENGEIKKLLAGKKAFVINTTGTPKEMYEASGMYKSLRQTIGEGILSFCGVDVAGHKFFSGVPFVTDKDRQAMLEEAKKFAEGM